MTSHATRLLLVLAMAVGTVSSSVNLTAQESLQDLAKKFPGYVNAVMAVNAREIRDSVISKANNWTDSYEGRVTSGLIFIPENADRVLLGAAMDFQTFHPRTTAILAEVATPPTSDLIRKATQGTIDNMLGYDVVETPNDMYVVPLEGNTVAAYRPAIRTDFLPWLSDLKEGKTNPVRDYLQEGLGYADLGTAIIIAFNLENVISRSRIYENIQDSEEIRENSMDAKEVARLVASCRGVTLGVTVTDKITGAVKIDFSEDVSSLEPLKGGIALGVLERIGLFVDDFDEWEAFEMTPNQIQVRGQLSLNSFRQLLAIVDAAPNDSMSMSGEADLDTYSDDPATVNKNYFTAVDGLVQGVKPKLSAGQAYTRNAKWLRKFAEKIDLLPTLNVDPEVVDFGVYAAEMLREASQYMIDTNAETKTKIQGLIASGARSGGGTGWGGAGGWGGTYGANYSTGRWGYRYGRRSGRGTGQRLRDSVRANQKTEAVRTLQEMFTEYDAQRADLRRNLTQKYNSEF
jgi:hypothetical protein